MSLTFGMGVDKTYTIIETALMMLCIVRHLHRALLRSFWTPCGACKCHGPTLR